MYHLKSTASLSKAFLAWCLGVTTLTAAWWLLELFAVPLMGSKLAMLTFVISYLLIGFWLTRRLTRDLIEWNSFYGTVDNISSFKSKMVMLWLIRWPLELGKMSFSRW